MGVEVVGLASRLAITDAIITVNRGVLIAAEDDDTLGCLVVGGWATASQASNLLNAQITGIGEAVASGDTGLVLGGSGVGTSSLIVSFLISEAITYNFEGQLTTEVFCPFDSCFPVADGFLRLKGPDDNDVFLLETNRDADFPETGTESFSTSGTLTTGEYVLRAYIRAPSAEIAGRSKANFDFDFAVIPEPTSGLLFTLGLPLLLVVWRSWS